MIPELVTLSSDGDVQGINFRHLTAVLVAAVQESQTENKLLREQFLEGNFRVPASLKVVIRAS